MSDELLAERRDDILHVTLNRPEKRNPLSRTLLEALRRCFEAHADDPTLRVAVLRGAGEKSFAAGGDLKDLGQLRSAEEAGEMADHAKAALDAVRRFPVPVVAALNGDALGGGAELAVACDFRVGARHARIGFVQGRLNIATAWGGGIDLLDLLGPAAGLRLLARSDLLDMESARAVGLVDAVAEADQPLDDAVASFVQPMLRQAPQVLRAFKALAVAHRTGASRSDMERLETRLFAGTWVHDDHWSAVERLNLGRR
ncbi:enoyl-CoA hydratase/isomerase family protein [Skermanella sp. TT6]|uniref:Enoyl-CoA hydratase/isomerase family protein n=1 Tax=Skermanella cutis TaxID=2775420 RepID=A0ABX7B7V0_9PROT|nr:enoyl-CoA hydratase/isomerase family protein [Skermanella sp. TT6]QQP90446.1 enoyl-CoA hydratase/isomerase family protein [Skermanella sp. TT6]